MPLLKRWMVLAEFRKRKIPGLIGKFPLFHRLYLYGADRPVETQNIESLDILVSRTLRAKFHSSLQGTMQTRGLPSDLQVSSLIPSIDCINSTVYNYHRDYRVWEVSKTVDDPDRLSVVFFSGQIREHDYPAWFVLLRHMLTGQNVPYRILRYQNCIMATACDWMTFPFPASCGARHKLKLAFRLKIRKRSEATTTECYKAYACVPFYYNLQYSLCLCVFETSTLEC